MDWEIRCASFAYAQTGVALDPAKRRVKGAGIIVDTEAQMKEEDPTLRSAAEGQTEREGGEETGANRNEYNSWTEVPEVIGGVLSAGVAAGLATSEQGGQELLSTFN